MGLQQQAAFAARAPFVYTHQNAALVRQRGGKAQRPVLLQHILRRGGGVAGGAVYGQHGQQLLLQIFHLRHAGFSFDKKYTEYALCAQDSYLRYYTPAPGQMQEKARRPAAHRAQRNAVPGMAAVQPCSAVAIRYLNICGLYCSYKPSFSYSSL